MKNFILWLNTVKILPVIAALLLATPSVAQEGGVLMPGAGPGGADRDRAPDVSAAPQPTIRRGSPVWVGYLAIVLMAAAVMGISLLPSKRSHQD